MFQIFIQIPEFVHFLHIIFLGTQIAGKDLLRKQKQSLKHVRNTFITPYFILLIKCIQGNNLFPINYQRN